MKNKIKTILLIALILAIYWLPDIIASYQVELLGSLTNTYAEILSLATVIESVSILFGLVFIFLLGRKLGIFKEWKSTFQVKNLLFIFSLMLVIYLSGQYLGNWYTHFANHVGNKQELLVYQSIENPIIFIIGLVITAPIFEEIIFRVMVFRFFKTEWLAFLVSVIIFPYVHTGFDYSYILYLPMAFMFTYAYARRKNAVDSMLLHFLNNFWVAIPLIIKVFFH
ncbi:MAG: lysostaphin resistance A-like protein [Lactococcus sp.]